MNRTILSDREIWESDGYKFLTEKECEVYENMKKLKFVKFHIVTSELLKDFLDLRNWFPDCYLYVIEPSSWEDITTIEKITESYYDDCQTYKPGDKVILTLSGTGSDDDVYVRHIVNSKCLIESFSELGAELSKLI